MNKVSWTIPIKTISEANSSENWTKSNIRHRQQQFFVRASFIKYAQEISPPCTVKMIRLASRQLDDEDNLRMAFKWIKDELGACLFPERVVTYRSKSGKVKQNKGHADSDPRVKWEYGQEKSKEQGVRIEISF